jgi:uncharacterized protein (TIGR02001 family)
MRTSLVLGALAVFGGPSLAAAEPLTFSGGVTATSNYLTDGGSDSGNRPAIQPFFEISKNGFYGGLWASNIKYDEGDRAELDVYAGYRGETAAGLEYDLTYTQYFYDKTHDFSSEIGAAFDVPLSDAFSVGAELTFDLGEITFGQVVSAEYAVTDALTIYADAGRADPEAGFYWDSGVTYDFNDQASLGFQYQDSVTEGRFAAVSFTYAFGNAD